MMGLIAVPDARALIAQLAGGLPIRRHFDFHGTRVGVFATEPATLALLDRSNAFFASAAAAPDLQVAIAEAGTPAHRCLARALGRATPPAGHLLLADWLPFAVRLRDRAILHYYLTKLVRLAVAEALADRYVTLHAASLSDGDGSGLLLVGEAATGKTSVTLSLLDRGFRYCSDDTSCLDRSSLRCIPFPMAFLLRGEPGTGHPVASARTRPDIPLLDEGRWIVERWDAVGDTFAPRFAVYLGAEDLAPGILRPLRPARAALGLLRNLVLPLGADPEGAATRLEDFDFACRLAEEMQSFEASSADLARSVDAIADLFDAKPALARRSGA